MRSSWCWSEPEEHAQAALGCALLIPTLGLVPMWMARRCAWPVVVHLSWAASGSALLLAAATVVGRVLPPLLEQAGGPWTPLAAALRAQGWAWLLLGLALPTLLALAHADRKSVV